MTNKLYKVVECVNDDKNEYIDLTESMELFKAEQWLTYYLNHECDAYLEEVEQ